MHDHVMPSPRKVKKRVNAFTVSQLLKCTSGLQTNLSDAMMNPKLLPYLDYEFLRPFWSPASFSSVQPTYYLTSAVSSWYPLSYFPPFFIIPKIQLDDQSEISTSGELHKFCNYKLNQQHSAETFLTPTLPFKRSSTSKNTF